MPPSDPARDVEPFEETHRGFVNTWECDENGHLNVQFYFRAFQQASEILALIKGQANPGARSAIVRHVRYHRELHVGRPIVIRSAVVGEGKTAGSLAHLLLDAENGKLCATALDQPGYRVDGVAVAAEAAVAAALPRGISPGPCQPADTAALRNQGKAVMTHRSVIRAEECGPDGDLLSSAIISRFSDGAPHAWVLAGISTDWLGSMNYGRVAVEMKLTRLGRAEASAALALVSWIEAMEEKTFVIRHQLEELLTGEAVASGEVRCLLMDLNARRAVPVPDFVRKSFAARQG